MPTPPRKSVRGVTGVAAAWAPPELSLRIYMAIGALQKGEASPDQQQFALDWIINGAARAYETSFRPESGGGDRATAFAEGRRFVGVQLVGVLNLSGEAVAELRSRDNG